MAIKVIKQQAKNKGRMGDLIMFQENKTVFLGTALFL